MKMLWSLKEWYQLKWAFWLLWHFWGPETIFHLNHEIMTCMFWSSSWDEFIFGNVEEMSSSEPWRALLERLEPDSSTREVENKRRPTAVKMASSSSVGHRRVKFVVCFICGNSYLHSIKECRCSFKKCCFYSKGMCFSSNCVWVVTEWSALCVASFWLVAACGRLWPMLRTDPKHIFY